MTEQQLDELATAALAEIKRLREGLAVFADDAWWMDHCAHCGHGSFVFDHDENIPDPAGFARKLLEGGS